MSFPRKRESIFKTPVNGYPETVFRLELAEAKLDMEKGFPCCGLYYDLKESWNKIEGINDSDNYQFGMMTEEEFCLTMPALDYIFNVWVSDFEPDDEDLEEDQKTIVEESREAAASLLQLNWYEGLIEDEEELKSVDAAAKKYAQAFLEIRSFESESEHNRFVLSLSKEQFTDRYIIKPLCSEIPVIEPGMPYFVDIIFYDIFSND